MIEKDEFFGVENGLSITDNQDVEGPHITGGPSSPIGLDLPTGTLYVENRLDGIKPWRKFGAGDNDWTMTDGLSRNDTSHDVWIPTGTVLIMPCGKFSCEVFFDGEGYVL